MSRDATSQTPIQMSLLGDSPVSRSATQESSAPRTTPDISGQKCLDLSGNAGPLGLLEKTLLESSSWAWTKYSLTWRAKATPQGRLIFQLARLAPRTSANGSGLLHTPTAGEPDGDTRQGQLGFGWSETSSHGSDADESGSHRAAEHQQDPKHGQTQLRDKQVGEFGQMGKDVADAECEGDGRGRLSGSRKDKSENGQRSSNQFVRCSKVVADANRSGQSASAGRGQDNRNEARDDFGRRGEDVADASSGRQRRSGKGQMGQSGRAETKRTSETLADTDETGCEQQRRSKSAQEEQPSIEHGGSLSDAERPRTRMEKSRDSGQGRKSADTRQSKVLRQEDGACSSEGLAASGNRPEVWWKVEPPVGRVVDGYPTEYLNSVPWETRSSRRSRKK